MALDQARSAWRIAVSSAALSAAQASTTAVATQATPKRIRRLLRVRANIDPSTGKPLRCCCRPDAAGQNKTGQATVTLSRSRDLLPLEAWAIRQTSRLGVHSI